MVASIVPVARTLPLLPGRKDLIAHAAGLPVLSALPGQFLLKDLVLIGVALWALGDALAAEKACP